MVYSFSFFSNKTSSQSRNSEKELPTVVDFNTLDSLNGETTSTNGEPLAKRKGILGSLLQWPFAVSAESTTASEAMTCPKIVDTTNKVIAMKQISGAEVPPCGENENEPGCDDFIDIEVRKLSYAEVAALDSNLVVPTQKKRQQTLDEVVTLGLENEIENTSNHLETMDDFEGCDRLEDDVFDSTLMDSMSAEDQWDDYVANKTSKKTTRKKKLNKRSKHMHLQ